MIHFDDLQRRKKNRLKDYDYSQNGAYFITICVKDRREIFSSIPVMANYVCPILTDIGDIIENEISLMSTIYEDVYVDKYVIMPNHIHMIIIIATDDEYGRTQFAPTVSRIIKQFKGSVTKKIGYSIWQKSFYDHIIRNKQDYRTNWQYIDENPARWEEDELNHLATSTKQTM